MCGVVGALLASDVNEALFDALSMLQHRGQDAAGMVTCQNKQFFLRKANGFVKDVFRNRHMMRLKGNMGIGHVRYPTAGSASEAEAQPFYVNSPYGIVLAHNGNLTNADQLKQELFNENRRHINTGSDSEVILNIFAHELQELSELKLSEKDIFAAIARVHKRCRGGYAVVMMIAGVGIVAFRDPYGIRPLIYGHRDKNGQSEFMVASESVALRSQGFSQLQDVQPGEAIFVDIKGNIHKKVCSEFSQLSPCLFEFVYFARPDSVIDKISVYKVRMNIGKKLATKIAREYDVKDIDVVIPIPDTARNAAIPLARQLNIEFREGFVKNRYVGRTFIMPGQTARKNSVRQKLSIIESEFNGKNVLIIDDSIVRGTTCKQIINMARDAGAKKVYFASAAPPLRYPNIYGIDMPTTQELIAYGRTNDEVREQIGADFLIYLDIEDLIAVAKEGNQSITRFEDSVFNGKYVTGDESLYLKEVANTRSENAKSNHSTHSECQIDLHNH